MTLLFNSSISLEIHFVNLDILMLFLKTVAKKLVLVNLR